MSIVDDYSRKVWVFLLKHKNEAFDHFKQWKVLIENLIDKSVKTLRADNGLEFCNDLFASYCNENGIQTHRTVIKILQQNGVAKRMNRTLLNNARCNLFNFCFPKCFKGEVIKMFSYSVHKCLSSAIEFKTPKEIWSSNHLT